MSADTLGDFRNISTISISLLDVAPYNFDTYQNGLNLLILVVKSIKLTLMLYFKTYEKNEIFDI